MAETARDAMTVHLTYEQIADVLDSRSDQASLAG
jgi:hypothetical protein